MMKHIGLLAVLAAAPVLSWGKVSSSDVVTSCTWLQDVYTDRFTVMCETDCMLSNLQLQYWPKGQSGKAKTCKFAYRPLLKIGKYIAVAKVSAKRQEGQVFEYRVLSKGAPVAREDVQGSVRLWKSGKEDGDFTAVIWGDNQSGIGAGDWDTDRFAAIHGAFNHMMTRNPDFGLSTGDMASSGNYNTQLRPLLLECTNPILGRYIPYYVSWGNHDHIPLTGLCNREFFSMTEDPSYVLAIADNHVLYRGDVLFVFVDSFCGKTLLARTKTKAWLKKVLSDKQAKNAKFRVVLNHEPFYLETWGRNEESAFRGVCSEYGVDLVLSGHMHGCERIEVPGTSFVQLTNGGLGYLDHGEKVENNYGDATKLGGHKDIPYLWARQDAVDATRLGEPQPVRMGCICSYTEMNVKGDKMTLAMHGFNADGSYIGVFDKFTLTARKAGEKGILAHSHPDVAYDKAAIPPEMFTVDAPVTKAEWCDFEIRALGRDVDVPSAAEAGEPATGMSRKEAEAYAKWVGGGAYRLPTADELSGAAFGDVAEWTTTDDAATGWCRISNCEVDFIATPDCSANYLGFRLVANQP